MLILPPKEQKKKSSLETEQMKRKITLDCCEIFEVIKNITPITW